MDLRYAIRVLLNRPAFTATAALTIALGIGSSTAIFSVVDAVLIRPLPFREPERLAVIWGVFGPERDVRGASYPEVMDWRALTRTFESISIVEETTLDLTEGGNAVQLEAEIVSAGFFDMLGIVPALGRGFLPMDDQPGVQPVVVISHDLWQTRLGADPSVVGRTLRLSDGPVTVVGVMPEGFRGLSFDTQIWTTLPPMKPELVEARNVRWLAALGRLRPATTFEQAQRDVESVARELEARYPDVNRERSADVYSLHDYFLGDARQLMVVLFGAALFLLLVASANVMSLQLVRGVARTREVSLRFALGANRPQVMHQLMLETLVLALAGSLIGLLIAYWSISLLLALVPSGAIPAYANIELNARAFAFALGLAAITAIVSGIAPAWRSTSAGISAALRGDARGFVSLGGRYRLQHLLVVGEIAIALPLLVGAGLMVRSLREQLATPAGFRTEDMVAARLNLPPAQYPPEARITFAKALVERLRTLPEIADVAMGLHAPLRGYDHAAVLQREGYPEERIRYYRHVVFPGWFRTLGIPLLKGRPFEATDDADAPKVAVVTQALAARFWPGEDPLGKRLLISDETVTVVGVVANLRYRDLTSNLMDPGEDPDVFLPFAQSPTTSMDVVVHTPQQGIATTALLQREVAALDPSIPIFDVQSLSAELAAQTALDRFGSALLAVFGGLALTLAAVGLYGVMAFVVGTRRREIAIRLAVGAEPRTALALVLRQGMSLVMIGAGLGLLASFAAGRLLQSLLFGVTARDPLTYATVSLLLLAVALSANLIPAYRAARIDPQLALKSGA